MYVKFLNLIPVLDLIFTVIGYISQYRQIAKVKCSDSISITKQIINIFIQALYVLYGLHYCTLTYVLLCIVCTLLLGLELLLTIWYKSAFIQFRARYKNKGH